MSDMVAIILIALLAYGIYADIAKDKECALAAELIKEMSEEQGDE